MILSSGFEIEEPRVFVPWGISERVLVDLFGAYNLRKVTIGHYDVSCVSLGGLHHELSFHFKPRVGGVLIEMEVYLKASRSLTQSFKRLQNHFEAAFGVPSAAKHVRRSFPEYSYTWKLKGVRIEHHVRDRVWDTDQVKVIKI